MRNQKQMDYLQISLITTIVVLVTMLSSFDAKSQEFERWSCVGTQEFLDARERMERGSVLPMRSFSYIENMLPTALDQHELPNSLVEFDKTQVSTEFKERVISAFRRIIDSKYLPENLEDYVAIWVEKKSSTYASIDGRPCAVLSYKIHKGNELDYVRLYWTEEKIEGFVTVNIQKVTPKSIESAAKQVLTLPLKNKKTYRIVFKGSDVKLLYPDESSIYIPGLEFPRTIQIEYEDQMLNVRGGKVTLQEVGNNRTNDLTAIAFVKYYDANRFPRNFTSGTYVEYDEDLNEIKK